MANDLNERIAAMEARMLAVETGLKEVREQYTKLDDENKDQNQVLSKLDKNIELLIQSFATYKEGAKEKKQDWKWVISFLFGGAIVPAILKVFGVI